MLGVVVGGSILATRLLAAGLHWLRRPGCRVPRNHSIPSLGPEQDKKQVQDCQCVLYVDFRAG